MTVSLIPFVTKELFGVVRHFLVLIPQGQGSFRVFAGSFKAVSRTFQESFQGVSQKFSRVFQETFKDVSR